MPIEFHCEYCQQMIRVPDESVGHQARCPFCQNVQPVPEPAPNPNVEQSPFGNPYADESSPFASTPQPTTPPNPPVTPGPPLTPDGANANASIGSNPYREPPANPYASMSQYTAVGADAFAQQMRLASHGDRFLGAVIDFMFFVVAIAPGLAVGFMASNSGSRTLQNVAVAFYLVGLLAYGISQCVLVSKRAQSVGKIVMQTRIITQSGAAPGFVHGVLLRSWLFGLIVAVFAFMCFFCFPFSPVILLVDALMVFGERRQCLHDMLASTYVVSDKVG